MSITKKKRPDLKDRKAKPNHIDKNGQEWIKAAEVSSRIADGCTKITIGLYAKQGYLTRDEANKTYPWPQVHEEYLEAVQNKKKTVVTKKHNIVIEEEQITNVLTTERLIEMIENGEKNADVKAYAWAKTLNEIIKAKKEQIKLKELEGKTLDINDVEKWVYNVSRQNKEFWLNWCESIAVKMGEELQVDTRLMNSILNKYVRENLERIAELPNGYESEALEGS